MDWQNLLTLVAVVIVWYVLMAKILPRFGVGT
jgi:hypothetical protein